MMKRVLMDASSGILLFKAGLMNRVLDLYLVVIAGSVYEELTPAGYAGAAYFQDAWRTSKIARLDDDAEKGTGKMRQTQMKRLGKGERDTICHYLNGAADFVLIDDGRGAGFCRKRKIPYINALLVPRIFYLAHLFSEAEYRESIRNVLEIGRYSGAVIEFGLHCSLSDVACFLPQV